MPKSKRKSGAKTQPAAPQQTQPAPATIRKGIYLSALIYVEGDQAPAEDFNALAKAALSDRLAWKHDPAHDPLVMTLKSAEEKTDVADDGGDGKDGGEKEQKFEF